MAVHSGAAVKAMQVWLELQRVSAATTRSLWSQWKTTQIRALSGQPTTQSPYYGNAPGVMARRWSAPISMSTFSTTAIISEISSTTKDDNVDLHAEEQEREHVFTPMRERDVMDRLESHSHQMSLDNVSKNCMAASDTAMSEAAEQYDGHNSTGGVSLSGVMQTNVPEPFRSTVRGTPTHMNMPGGGTTRADKYLAGHIKDVHPSRQYSTSSKNSKVNESDNLYTPYSDMQGVQGDIDKSVEETLHLENPCPQGVQGQDCEHFKMWLDNCVRYGLPGCDDNLKAFRMGRKTLLTIFAEQEKMIRLAAQQYHQYSTSARQAESPKNDRA